MPQRGLRFGLVALLVLAAFFMALPWLGCGTNPRTHLLDPNVLGVCTFGFPEPPGVPSPYSYLPGVTGPYWGSLLVGIVYLVAAFYVAFTKRSL